MHLNDRQLRNGTLVLCAALLSWSCAPRSGPPCGPQGPLADARSREPNHAAPVPETAEAAPACPEDWRRHRGSEELFSEISRETSKVKAKYDTWLTKALTARLRQAGAKAVTPLLRVLQENKRVEVSQVAQAFGVLGLGAVPVLKSCARTAVLDVAREATLRGLHAMRLPPASVLPTFIAALRDRAGAMRFQAVRALGEMKSDAAPAIPALLVALRHGHPETNAEEATEEKETSSVIVGFRAYAAEALGDIGASLLARGGKDARLAVDGIVPALIHSIETGRSGVRYQALDALMRLGADAIEQGKPAIARALQDRHPSVRESARMALELLARKRR